MFSIALPLALALAPGAAQAQQRPYIGYAYPAGGQRGTTFQVKVGGQVLDGVDGAIVSGEGVEANLLSYQRRLNPQDSQLLREQLQELRQIGAARGAARTVMEVEATAPTPKQPGEKPEVLAKRIQRRLFEYVQQPACASIASIAWVEITIDPDAAPGPRELRLVTPRGVSNPLVFHVGQVPEFRRKPMISAPLQVLGKEEAALRKRAPEDLEHRVEVPCTVNGQIASGDIDRYRFEARKGQKIVITTEARKLIPYIADAVPGWFQPVITLRDASGKEVAYDDDYQFQPDPVLLVEVSKDGEYVLSIQDALYRGREDFVYRATIGEMPFITSRFPLGGPAEAASSVAIEGWNLDGATLVSDDVNTSSSVHNVFAKRGQVVSNSVVYEVDSTPRILESEPNNLAATAPRIAPDVTIDGRIDQPGDRDVFRFEGKAGREVVVEVKARRLGSSLDSEVRITDEAGTIIGLNDDTEGPEYGAITHNADSYVKVTLPADGAYFATVSDASGGGGPSHGYRLRVGPPRPDFEVRTVPSSVAMRGKSAAAIDVHVARRDGFDGPIQVALKDAPEGFSTSPVTIAPTQVTAKLTIRTSLTASEMPVRLDVVGTATIGGQKVERAAVPAEDRMQAFLWRHLVPASELYALVYDPSVDLQPRRGARLKKKATTTKP
jgi:hypothetical protein